MRSHIVIAFLLAVAIFEAACGNSQVAEGGIGGTGRVFGVSSGRITGFGSVFVNGVEYETTNAEVVIEEVPGYGESELAVGMVVTVKGAVNADGVTGVAERIEFADQLEGIVDAPFDSGNSTLRVVGQTVHVLPETVFANAVVTDIVEGVLVEVSGYSAGDGNIHATRIELKQAIPSDSQAEVKGIVQDLTADSFRLGDLTIRWTGDTVVTGFASGSPEQGRYVEVQGAFNAASSELTASEVALEGDGTNAFNGKDGDEVELEGVVTAGYDPITGIFGFNGQQVLLGTGALDDGVPENELVYGRSLTFHGRFNGDGVLIAEEVRLQVDGASSVELEGLAAVDGAGRLMLMGVAIDASANTLLVDEVGGNRRFTAADIGPGDWIEVYGSADGARVAASRIVRRIADPPWELEGLVISVDPLSRTLEVAGVAVRVPDGITLPAVGDRVEAEGTFDGSVFAAATLTVGTTVP